MIETPQVLSETPAPSPPRVADLLSDLLDSMHLSGVVFLRTEFQEPWSVVTPDARHLARLLHFRTEHVIPFHVIAQGGCWLGLAGRDPVWLSEGDAVLLPYGDSHSLRGREQTAPVPVAKLLSPPPWTDLPMIRHGGAGATTRLVCGFLQCDEWLFSPILRHLPALIHVSPAAHPGDDWLGATIRHTAQEAGHVQPGTRSMLPRLAELMYVEVLRQHMQGLSADEVGLFAALKDPVAGAALGLLHAAPLEDWSVDRLARRVGVSRTVLATRFKHFLDQPPMQYLTRWRLLLAAQLLKTTDTPLKLIADRSGYESEAAFSRAFRRRFGAPPADWRRQQRTQGNAG